MNIQSLKKIAKKIAFWLMGIATILFILFFVFDFTSDSKENRQELVTITQRLQTENPNLSATQIEMLAQAEKNSQSVEQKADNTSKISANGSKVEPAQDFNWWVLFPFGVAVLMIIIIFYTKTKPLTIGAVLILIGTIVFFYYYRNWFVPGLDMIDEKLGNPSVSSTEIPNNKSSLNLKPKGGVVVAEKITAEKKVVGCTHLITQKTFTPGFETFGNLPLLASVGAGKYFVTAEGSRKQDFYQTGGTTPIRSRVMDTEGNFLDNADGKKTVFMITDPGEKSLMLLPDKPYGIFTLTIGTNNIPIGKSYYFQTKENLEIKMNLNVQQTPWNYTGTGSFTINIYQCKK